MGSADWNSFYSPDKTQRTLGKNAGGRGLRDGLVLGFTGLVRLSRAAHRYLDGIVAAFAGETGTITCA
jgi:hypothetical protein